MSAEFTAGFALGCLVCFLYLKWLLRPGGWAEQEFRAGVYERERAQYWPGLAGLAPSEAALKLEEIKSAAMRQKLDEEYSKRWRS